MHFDDRPAERVPGLRRAPPDHPFDRREEQIVARRCPS
jgi:hypothetical protein